MQKNEHKHHSKLKINIYFKKKFKLEKLVSKNNPEFKSYKKYFVNAKSDAFQCYSLIQQYLNKNIEILEIGGGIHLLTSYLNQNYKILSIEPGGFNPIADKLRKEITKEKLYISKSKLENFKTKKKFDLIFSMNVLEHTSNIHNHIKACLKLLKNKNSTLLIFCPNYVFPFEPHFYKWFIPFFPRTTFKFFKKKLIIEFDKNKYKRILNSLNFNSNFFKIKSFNLKINFIHPINYIFNRIDEDIIFRDRLFQNKAIKIFFYLIKFFKLQKILTFIMPISISPYLIMTIKK